MNTDNRKEDLQCIVLGFVLHAVVMENDHGIGMSFSSRTCALLRLFFKKRVRVVFGSKDFSPKTHLLGKKIGVKVGIFSRRTNSQKTGIFVPGHIYGVRKTTFSAPPTRLEKGVFPLTGKKNLLRTMGPPFFTRGGGSPPRASQIKNRACFAAWIFF